MSSPVVPDRPRLPWDPPDHFEKRVPEGDNRERLVCGRCEFIHYQNPKIVAGSVCTWSDTGSDTGSDKGNEKILIAKRAIEPRKGFWTLPAGYMELGETTEQAAQREAREEACAAIEIDRLLAMYSVARIGQVQIMYRARLVSADIAAGPESEEVALVDFADIPWEQLAFPTVVWALAHFHDSRGKTDFATYSNPTGDLARMWPPRKPAGL
jgi:ADP-ribose pyrophosphatase YjhB (NUDIX family)